MPKQILVVDDHPVMRDGIVQWLSQPEDLRVCGQAESAVQALLLVEKLKPDLVLTDISLKGSSGLELIKELRYLQPGLAVLVFSMHDELLYAGRALEAGARGYLMKCADGNRVVEAIREIFAGRIAVSADTATRLLEEYSGRRSRTGRAILPTLTDREFEIFQLLGEAKSNREIADQLHLSAKTVGTHRMNIAVKLKLRNSADLIRHALHYTERASIGSKLPTSQAASA